MVKTAFYWIWILALLFGAFSTISLFSVGYFVILFLLYLNELIIFDEFSRKFNRIRPFALVSLLYTLLLVVASVTLNFYCTSNPKYLHICKVFEFIGLPMVSGQLQWYEVCRITSLIIITIFSLPLLAMKVKLDSNAPAASDPHVIKFIGLFIYSFLLGAILILGINYICLLTIPHYLFLVMDAAFNLKFTRKFDRILVLYGVLHFVAIYVFNLVLLFRNCFPFAFDISFESTQAVFDFIGLVNVLHGSDSVKTVVYYMSLVLFVISLILFRSTCFGNKRRGAISFLLHFIKRYENSRLYRLFFIHASSILVSFSCIIWAITFPSFSGLGLFFISFLCVFLSCKTIAKFKNVILGFPAALSLLTFVFETLKPFNFPEVKVIGMQYDPNISSSILLQVFILTCLRLACSAGDVASDESRSSSVFSVNNTMAEFSQPVPVESTPSIMLVKVKRLFLVGWDIFVHFVCRYTYLLDLILIFACSLQQINLLNAGYLIFFLLFLGFPKLSRRYWVTIVIYSQLVLLSLFLYQLPTIRELTPEHIVGPIGIEYYVTPWSGLAIHVFIFLLAFVQFKIYGSLEFEHEVPEMYNSSTLVEFSQARKIMVLCKYFYAKSWIFATMSLLLVVPVVGSFNLINFGYLFIVSVFVLDSILMPLHSIFSTKLLWSWVLVYEIFVILLLYASHFPILRVLALELVNSDILNLFGLNVDVSATSSAVFFKLTPYFAAFLASIMHFRILWRPYKVARLQLWYEQMEITNDLYILTIKLYVKQFLCFISPKLLYFTIVLGISRNHTIVNFVSASLVMLFLRSRKFFIFLASWLVLYTSCIFVLQFPLMKATIDYFLPFNTYQVCFLGFAETYSIGLEGVLMALSLLYHSSSVQLMYTQIESILYHYCTNLFFEFGYEVSFSLMFSLVLSKANLPGLLYCALLVWVLHFGHSKVPTAILKSVFWCSFVLILYQYFTRIPILKIYDFLEKHIKLYPRHGFILHFFSLPSKFGDRSSLIADFVFLFLLVSLFSHGVGSHCSFINGRKFCDRRMSISKFLIFRYSMWLVLMFLFLFCTLQPPSVLSVLGLLLTLYFMHLGESLLVYPRYAKKFRRIKYYLISVVWLVVSLQFVFFYFYWSPCITYEARPKAIGSWARTVASCRFYFFDLWGIYPIWPSGSYSNVSSYEIVIPGLYATFLIMSFCGLLFMERIFAAPFLPHFISYLDQLHQSALTFSQEKSSKLEMQDDNADVLEYSITFSRDDLDRIKDWVKLYQSNCKELVRCLTDVDKRSIVEDNSGSASAEGFIEASTALSVNLPPQGVLPAILPGVSSETGSSFQSSKLELGDGPSLEASSASLSESVYCLDTASSIHQASNHGGQSERVDLSPSSLKSHFLIKMLQYVDSFIFSIFFLSWRHRKLSVDSIQESQVLEKFANSSGDAAHRRIWLRVKYLYRALGYFFIANLVYIAYFLLYLNQIISGNLLTMIPNIAFLVVGLKQRPYVSGTFWNSFIIYMKVYVSIKYLFQSKFWTFNDIACDATFWDDWTVYVGIQKQCPNFGSAVILIDLFLLVIVLWQRNLMKQLGIYDRPNNRSPQKIDKHGFRVDDSRSLAFSLGDSKSPSFFVKVKDKMNKLCNSVTGSMDYIVMEAREKDYYNYIFAFDFVCFILSIIFWSSFSGEARVVLTRKSSGSFEGTSEFLSHIVKSGAAIPPLFVLFVILNFFMLIIDRAVYITRQIFWKFVLQIGTVLVFHFWLFILLTKKNQLYFRSNTPLQIWYLFKCCYWFFSALQLKIGYPRHPSYPRGSLEAYGIEQHPRLAYYFLLIYRGAIPFLFECKSIIDWCLTPSTLTLFNWLKFEDIYGNLCILKCNRIIDQRGPRKFGSPQRSEEKKLLGLLLIILLVVLLWFPLIILSLPSDQRLSTVKEFKVELGIKGFGCLGSFHSKNMGIIPSEDFIQLKAKGIFPSFASVSEIHRLHFERVSHDVYDGTPPLEEELFAKLLDPTSILEWECKWTVMRESQAVSTGAHYFPIDIYSKSDLCPLFMPNSASNDEEQFSNVMPRAEGRSNTNARLRTTILTLDPKIFPKYLSVYRMGAIFERFDNTTPNDFQVEPPEYIKLRVTKVGNQMYLAFEPKLTLKADLQSRHQFASVRLDDSSTAHIKQSSSSSLDPDNKVSSTRRLQFPEDLLNVYEEGLGDEDSPSNDIPQASVRSLAGSTGEKFQRDEGSTFTSYIFSEPVSHSSDYFSNAGVIGLYVTIVFTAGRFLRMLVTGQTIRIINDDLPNVDFPVRLCQELLKAREAGDFHSEEFLFWTLIDLYRTPTLLKEKTKIE